MVFRRKSLALLVAVALAGAGVIGCSGTDDPEVNNQEPNNQEPNNQEPNNQEPNNQEPNNQEPNNQDDPEFDAPEESGDVLLSEFMKWPTEVDVDDGQWVEFYNNTDDDLDLMGCVIESSAMDEDLEIGDSLEIESGAFITIANSDEPGFEPTWYDDALSLSMEDGSIALVCDDTTISYVDYDDGVKYPAGEGASIVRDHELYDHDEMDEPWLWCEGTDSYNGDDLGTPGAMADACPWYDESTAEDLADIVDDARAGEDFDPVVLEHVLVTYARDYWGSNDVAGFFLQASADGPALFVSDDDADTIDDLSVRAGQVIDITVNAATDEASGVEVTDVEGIEVVRNFVPPSMLTTDVTDADDVVSNLDDYSNRMVEAELDIVGSPSFAGFPFQGYEAVTNGVDDAGGSLVLRIPEDLMGLVGLDPDADECLVTVSDTPMWRFNDTAQFSAWFTDEITAMDCGDTMLDSVGATDETEVQLSFSRAIEAFDVDDVTIDGLDIISVEMGETSAVLETEVQDGDTTYTVELSDDVVDLWGNAVDADDMTFQGFEPMPVVISEFMARFQGGTGDPGQFMEFTNTGNEDFSFAGCELDRPDVSTGPWALDDITIEPGETMLLTATDGGDADLDNDGILEVNLVNGGTTVELICDGDVVDAITYAGSDVELGVSQQRDVDLLAMPNEPGGLSDSLWCLTPQESAFEYTTGTDDGEPKYGTPGEENIACE